ncbi:chemotaxis protein CheW [Pontibacter sp. E15-1]|uniref:chemotaxis protein CheW n=1 Tax=Pontibacter sp. E15-1 TaxID=2919918 RepID=UPI001F4F5175|nr:chemotaxis protein CheW [Pontibacter sp. E15-1]MCJ8166656.1 chemotaxis protein CheW [Pontibacter sp. E15-1]
MAKQTKTDNTAAAPGLGTGKTPASMSGGAASPQERPQAEGQQESEQMIHLIVFKLGVESYAIRIEQVKEVTVTPAITRMPRTPHFVKGVANIRGDIIAIMDLEDRFHIKPAPLTEDSNPNITYTLVIEARDYSIGVAVKEMPQSLNLAVSKIDRAPALLQAVNINENFIEGLAKTSDRLIVVLDMYKILTQDEISELTE